MAASVVPLSVELEIFILVLAAAYQYAQEGSIKG
jgi:hypothetical protein